MILTVLGTYWLTLALTQEDGPFGVFYKLRRLKALGVLQCFTCSSLWVAAVLSLLVASNFLEWVLYTLASAGGAAIIYEVVERLKR